MYPYVIHTFPSSLGAEGYTRWMYSDDRGFVTVGRGNLLETANDAAALDWRHSADGTTASPDEVRAAWQKVKDTGHLKAGGASADAAALTGLTLTDDATKLLVTSDANRIAGYMDTLVPAIQTAPADAQMAVLRWAWAMGPRPDRAPKMFNAVRNGDWLTAADNAHWQGEDPTVDTLIRQLFKNAADVSANGLDPIVLLWPRTIETYDSTVATRETPTMGTESADQAESYVFRNADGEVSIPKAHVDLNDPSVIDPFGLGGAAAGVAAAAKQATATAETAKESIGELQSTVVKTATAAQGAIDNAQKALAEGQAYAKDADMAVKVGLGLALGVVAVKLFTGYLEKRAERK